MPDKIVVINSTPIIALSSINKLYLLKELYSEVNLPAAVYMEVQANQGSKAQIELDQSLDWLRIKQIENVESKKFFRLQLHDGEVEVMILGKEIKAELLIIDDYIAREYAKYLDFKVTGTLGVILKAKETGLVEKIKPLLDKLVESGIYIGNRVYKEILEIAGE